jgi:hypothetical protein
MVRLGKSCLFVALVVLAGCKEASTPVATTSVVTEAAGQNCASGGVAILVGIDTNGDGAVSASEAKSTSYVCNAPAGTLVRVSDEAAGTNCEFGGSRLDTGPDTNGNGTLDASESTASQYLCNEAAGVSLLTKTRAKAADASCPGGYVRLAFGADDDADGTLETAEEDTVFITCNLAPTITKPNSISVPNCGQAFTLPLTIADADGTVTTVTAQVLASGSTITASVDSNNRVSIASGMHVGGAVLEVTATDDLGATTTSTVLVSFSGTGCTPDLTFYGVLPSSCVGIEVDPIAGDDRSGPVLTSRGAYYNGDEGLVLVSVDAQGRLDAGQIIDRRIDTLMGDIARGELLSLWSSTWSADGGSFDAGLLDAPVIGFNAGYDEVAAIDESTFQPTRRVTLPSAVISTFTVTDSAMAMRTVTTDRVLVSAVDGHALVVLSGTDQTDRAFRYMLVDTMTGTAVVDRSVVLGISASNDWSWDSQEDSIQHYALTHRGSSFWLTYKSTSGAWYELELAAGSPLLRSESFGANCDLQNLALTADGREAWFHTESDCFDISFSESVIRCSTLLTSNLDGGIDDSGGGNNPEGR